MRRPTAWNDGKAFAKAADVRPDLRHQVALVTGGGRGIGRAIALRLAAAQCRVAVLSRTAAELDETVEAATELATEEVMPIVADVTRDTELQHAVQMILERLGRIAILVNNAGFATPRRSIVRSSLDDWDRTLDTCLRAPMVLTRLVLPDMLAHASGTIINIASVAAKHGRGGEAAYAAAKFGLLGFTQSLYEEVHNRGIKVTAICPGLVDTSLIPSNARVDRAKFLQPEDIADLVHQVATAPFRMCPREIVVEPQYDPEAP